jgi:hypothetical protein
LCKNSGCENSVWLYGKGSEEQAAFVKDESFDIAGLSLFRDTKDGEAATTDDHAARSPTRRVEEGKNISRGEVAVSGFGNSSDVAAYLDVSQTFYTFSPTPLESWG